MTIFKNSADRLPVAVIMALFFMDLAVYWYSSSYFLSAAWMVLALGPKACICAWNHHHQHVSTFIQTPLNRALELVYAFHTGITTNAWVLHHNLGHHLNYLDQSKDESGWQRKDGSTMNVVEYTVKIALTGYVRAYRVGRKHPKFQKSFLQMGVVVALLLAVLLYFRPMHAFLVFCVPMFVGYVVTCWHTYYHHAGLDTEDPLEASYNIEHKWYNRLTGNLGYHTAHHMKQGLHWSRLPEFHETIREKIPPHLYRRPSIPFCWFPAQ